MDRIEEIATRIHSRERLMYKGQRIAPWQSRWEDLPKEVKGKYLEEAQQIHQLYQPKAEDGGLLNSVEYQQAAERGLKSEHLGITESILMAQRDLTSRLKDAEWEKKLVDVHTKACQGSMRQRAECQKRVKKIFEEIECVWPSWKGAGWWQILKQKEGL